MPARATRTGLPQPSSAAVATVAAAPEQLRSRRRRRAGIRGYAHEFMEMNINVDPDWDEARGGSTATSDRGAAPLGFAGTVQKEFRPQRVWLH